MTGSTISFAFVARILGDTNLAGFDAGYRRAQT